LTPLEELNGILSSGERVIVVSNRDVDLTASQADNTLFLLKILEGSLASGGRGGGMGERKVVRVAAFSLREGEWVKTLDAEDEARVSLFEVPYHVSRLPMTLLGGTEVMGYGVVDPGLVAEFSAKTA
jgi:hypothetical protein